MSAYPITIDGTSIEAVIIGGGAVARRKALRLLDAGARVRVVAPRIDAELERASSGQPSLELIRESYRSVHLGAATLVFAATDDAAVNAEVARDATAAGKLVNVADAAASGSFITPAVHRAGDLVVAVTAGGVPSAAVRVRDLIGARVGSRYADAVDRLAHLRRTLLSSGRRDDWSRAASTLVGDDFCEQVEAGDFETRVAAWR